LTLVVVDDVAVVRNGLIAIRVNGLTDLLDDASGGRDAREGSQRGKSETAAREHDHAYGSSTADGDCGVWISPAAAGSGLLFRRGEATHEVSASINWSGGIPRVFRMSARPPAGSDPRLERRGDACMARLAVSSIAKLSSAEMGPGSVRDAVWFRVCGHLRPSVQFTRHLNDDR
jgi:hypothetical protein